MSLVKIHTANKSRANSSVDFTITVVKFESDCTAIVDSEFLTELLNKDASLALIEEVKEEKKKIVKETITPPPPPPPPLKEEKGSDVTGQEDSIVTSPTDVKPPEVVKENGEEGKEPAIPPQEGGKEKVVSEAQQKINIDLAKKLTQMTKEDLIELANTSNLPVEEWKGLTKVELVKYLIQKSQ